MKAKQTLLSKLFYNNKFVMFFSLFVSFCIWISIASGSTESMSKTVDGINLNIELSEEAINDGLEVFSGDDITAQVTVTGNRVTIGSLSKSDIQIVAEGASSITRPGSYIIDLKAKKTGLKSDYEIVSSVSPSRVTIFVDRYREREFTIEDNMQYKVNDEYFAGSMVFSSNKVTVSGAETDISKIAKVAVRGTVENELSESITLKKQIVLFDSYNKPITSDFIKLDMDSVEVTIPVLQKKKIPFDIEYLNKPDWVDINDFVKIEPTEIEVAATDEQFKQIGEKVMFKSIDFSALRAINNKFSFPIELPAGCKNIDNISTASVSIDLSDMVQRTYSISNFEFVNIDPDNEAVTTSSSLSIMLMGLPSELNKIKTSDIKAIIDMSSKGEDFVGTTEMTISSFDLGSKCNCWVIGNYNVYIRVTSPKSN